MTSFDKRFWAAAGERALKTVAQAAVALLTAGATGILGIDWMEVLSVSALAGVVSVLTSIAGGIQDGNPSYGVEEVRPAGRRAAGQPIDPHG